MGTGRGCRAYRSGMSWVQVGDVVATGRGCRGNRSGMSWMQIGDRVQIGVLHILIPCLRGPPGIEIDLTESSS